MKVRSWPPQDSGFFTGPISGEIGCRADIVRRVLQIALPKRLDVCKLCEADVDLQWLTRPAAEAEVSVRRLRKQL